MQFFNRFVYYLALSIELLGEMVVSIPLFIVKILSTVVYVCSYWYISIVSAIGRSITGFVVTVLYIVGNILRFIRSIVKSTFSFISGTIVAIKHGLAKTIQLLMMKFVSNNQKVKKTVKNTRPNQSILASSPVSLEGVFKLRSIIIALVLILIVIGLFQTNTLLSSIPNPKKLDDFALPASTQIYDRNGILLYSAYSDINRVPIKYKEVPKTLVDATIAAEDKNFFSHSGFDYIRIVKALVHNSSHDDTQGASTITQQLAKNVFLNNERTWTRKIKEAIITRRIESNFTKEQILELYFNTISYGGDTVGTESASERYFGKRTSQLTSKESVFLASLPVAPSILLYSPQKDLNSTSRMNYILNQMIEMKNISKKDKEQILKQKLTVLPTMNYKRAPAYVDYVLNKLEKQFGKAYLLRRGLIVRTSLDLELQNKAQQIILEQITKYQVNNVNNGAVLIINPANGDILAMVGSVNYFDPNGGQYNVVTSARQLGSAVKLITYTAALESSLYKPETMLKDQRRFYPDFPEYVPHNYDNKEHGTVTLKEAFANSYNLPALNVAYDLGLDKVAAQGVKMGITEFDRPKDKLPLAMVLGGIEMPLEHLTGAYGVIANGGKKVEIDPFLKIEDYDGTIIYQKKYTPGVQVVTKKTADSIFNILSDPNARMAMFGRSPQFDFLETAVGVKTGTSNDARDNTAFAFTKDFVVGTWIGNNDNSAMTDISSGYVGATSIMHDVTMQVINRDKNRIQTRL